jgi:hypothetical protein
MSAHRRPGLRFLSFSTCLFSLVTACADDGRGGDTNLPSGTSTATDLTVAPTTGPSTTDVDPTEQGSGSGCAAPNECGGCGALDVELGAPCNGCDGLAWACDPAIAGAAICAGDDPFANPYYPDADGDGYGDKNAPPVLACVPQDGLVPDGSDCLDSDPDANPDGEEVCNDIDDNCNGTKDEGPPDSFCPDACCDVEQACTGGSCVAKCPNGELCGADLELCCEGGTTCIANQCVTPGSECEFDEECAADEVCPVFLGQCVPGDILPMCEFVPEFGPFKPVQACQWTSAGLPNPARRDVVATPIVLNLTDDNGDGLTNDDDTPDIAFMTYDLTNAGCCNVDATLRIVSGECNDDKSMNTLASLAMPVLTNDVGIAGGDLDGDGVPELVAVSKVAGQPQGTVAFRRTAADGSAWEVLWHNQDYPKWNVHTRGGPTISLADLEGDGVPEVIVGNVVLEGDSGALKWDGVVTAGGMGGIGNNGFLGPSSTVADIDLDGVQEVIAGNTVYAADGSVVWTFNYMTNNSPCGGGLPCDGFNAVANLDADDEAEVVIVRLGEVFVLDTDGTQLSRIALPKIDCANNESGPPTIADFDGDGRREIGTASADYYVVADLDCDVDPLPMGCSDKGVLWKTANEDCSSRVTASSVFDFEGDDKAEVIYADEIHFRIFDGSTGTILFSDNTYRSHTRIEMPAIADVNNDGHADIVIGENSYNNGKPGLEVWRGELNDWVRTRRVWNQHGYYITNITKDGTIPALPEKNWLNTRFNNFRQNVQPGGLFYAPDATVVGLICDEGMVGQGKLVLSIVVKNDGALPIEAGTPVKLEIDKDGVLTPLATTATNKKLLPGQSEVLDLEVALPMDAPGLPYDIKATIDPDNTVDECIEDNNSSAGGCAIPG